MREYKHNPPMPDNSFDIVSKIELPEVSNAVQQALKEILQRYDLKDSKSSIELNEKENKLILHSRDEFIAARGHRHPARQAGEAQGSSQRYVVRTDSSRSGIDGASGSHHATGHRDGKSQGDRQGDQR